MGYPAMELPPAEEFLGCGVYTIHYQGDFAAYEHLTGEEPIYVGKAESSGKRQGKRTKAPSDAPRIWKRLEEHARSIEESSNLALADFRCRWLVLDSIWIGLTEQVLITTYRPLWNMVVDGFGTRNPGKGRRNQRRSRWDTLHPGRSWAETLPTGIQDAADILAAIKNQMREK